MLTASPRWTLLFPLASLVLPACGDDSTGETSAGTALTTGETGTATTAPTTDTPTTDTPTTDISTTGGGQTSSGATTSTISDSSTGAVTITTTDATTTVDPSTTGSTGVSSDSTSGSTGDPPCPDGTIVCEGDTAKTCDGMGGFKNEEACAGVCIADVGCKLCDPGSTACKGDNVLAVQRPGRQPRTPSRPATGSRASPATPTRAPARAPARPPPSALATSAATTTRPSSCSTTSTTPAPRTTTPSRSPTPPTRRRQDHDHPRRQQGRQDRWSRANSVKLINLPWVNELTKSDAASVLVKDGAYRLRSNNPVTVYQYNPIKATTTNDASVLLPVNTWTGNYLVASWDFWASFNYPGFYAVVARADGTKVTITPSATGNKVRAGGGVAADGNGVIMLDDGDVLEVVNSAADLTGTIITADKPVQVFGGHECTNVPLNVTACDHLEESMFPIETLAKEYLVVPPVQVPNDQLEKAQMVRIIASEANTTLVFDPDQPVAKNLAKAGDFVQIATTTAKFLVTADKKIMVAQYMVGQDGGYGTSDPAMLLAVNPLQWRKSYLVHAPTSWVANYVDLMAKTGTTVSVDGVNAGGWKVIGNTGYSYTHVKLSNNGNGNHSIMGDATVGVGVYGVQNYGSYWYPGGLDLDVIPQ